MATPEATSIPTFPEHVSKLEPMRHRLPPLDRFIKPEHGSFPAERSSIRTAYENVADSIEPILDVRDEEAFRHGVARDSATYIPDGGIRAAAIRVDADLTRAALKSRKMAEEANVNEQPGKKRKRNDDDCERPSKLRMPTPIREVNAGFPHFNAWDKTGNNNWEPVEPQFHNPNPTVPLPSIESTFPWEFPYASLQREDSLSSVGTAPGLCRDLTLSDAGVLTPEISPTRNLPRTPGWPVHPVSTFTREPLCNQASPMGLHSQGPPQGVYQGDYQGAYQQVYQEVLQLPPQGPPQGPSRAGKKKHPCPLRDDYNCGDTFTTSGHASRHAKIHTGKKDAVCPECKKEFGRKDNMSQHRLTHTRGGRTRGRTADRSVPSDDTPTPNPS